MTKTDDCAFLLSRSQDYPDYLERIPPTTRPYPYVSPSFPTGRVYRFHLLIFYYVTNSPEVS